MSMMITVYIFTAFDVWLYDYFLKGIFERRYENKWLNRGILLIVTLLFVLVNSRQRANLNLLAGISLFFALAAILYQGKIRMILLYEMLFYVAVALMEAIASFLIASILETEHIIGQSYDFIGNPINIIIAKMLTYMVIVVLQSMMKRRKEDEYEFPLRKTIFLPVTSLILIVGVEYSFIGNNTLVIIGCVLLLFANVFMFYCIEEMTIAQEKNKQYELEKVQYDMKEIYYEKMEEISVDHRKYVHNLKDYLQTIGGLAMQGKAEEIVGLLQEMETEIESIREKRYTGNNILNALLCEKESIAKKYDIQMLIEPAAFMTFSYAKNHDLIVMVGNLLDNAIEAASQCEGTREISMCFLQEQGNFETIQIENTYNGVYQKEGERFISIKKDEKKHGFGVTSVEKTAQKYGGVLLLEPEDTIFTAILTLSKVYYEE